MKIISAIEAIPVSNPIFLLVGQPGICKTSLGYSMADPLLLDFDKGAHRAVNRRDTLVIDTWGDAAELLKANGQLAPYASLVIDTAGRCLDVLSIDIAGRDAKLARAGGALTQQGFGVLKGDFAAYVRNVRALGKDVLLLAHQKEESKGDDRIVRADIIGGSFGEVMRIADFVGYLYRDERGKRILDFDPVAGSLAKNPGGWKPFDVPPIAKAADFMRELYAMGRAALGQMSEASAIIAKQLLEWRGHLETLTAPEAVTAAIVEVKRFTHPIALAQAKKALLDRATALGFRYDVKAAMFVGPAGVPATVTVPAAPAVASEPVRDDERLALEAREAVSQAAAQDTDGGTSPTPAATRPAPDLFAAGDGSELKAADIFAGARP